MPKISATTVFLGIGVIGLAATLVLGAMMWMEQRRADAVDEATRAGEVFQAEMRDYWPAAVDRIDAAAQDGDLQALGVVIDDVVAEAPELAEASEHAAENSYAYRTAAELRAATIGALEDLDDHVAHAIAVEEFVGHARVALQSPQDLIAEAPTLNAETLRSHVVDVIRDAADAARDVDPPRLNDADELEAAYAEALDTLTQATERAITQGEEMADRLDAGQPLGSFDYGEQRAAAVTAVDELESISRTAFGTVLGPVLSPALAGD